jgi:hypothetical protein
MIKYSKRRYFIAYPASESKSKFLPLKPFGANEIKNPEVLTEFKSILTRSASQKQALK